MNGKQVEIRRYYGYIQEMVSMFSDWLLKASMAQTGGIPMIFGDCSAMDTA